MIEQVAAARRTYLSLFVMKVFKALRPGEPPLRMSWYIQAVCHKLEETYRGTGRPLVITVSPPHLKSVTTFVAWILGQWSADKVIIEDVGSGKSL